METIILPKNKWWQLDVKEIWRFKDLFYFLAWRDIKVKYKQTAIGILWAIFRPFFTMIIFTVFFSRLAHIPSEGVPYPIFVYAGLLFWTLFSGSLNDISDAFVGNEKIISKVYFPRIILPVSSLLVNLVDFLVAAIIFVGMAIFYSYTPSLTGILLLPLLVIMSVASSLGIGLLFASLNVKYRDVRYVLPYFIQLLIFITPVIYPINLVSPNHRWVLGLNPMSGVIDAARAGLLANRPIDWGLLAISLTCLIFYFIIGYIYFKKVEREFADYI